MPFLFNLALKLLSRAIRQEKEIKGIQIEKEEVNHLHSQMTQPSIQTLLRNPLQLFELMSSARLKDARSINKNLLYFYSSSEQTRNVIKKQLFTLASKRIKCLGINLTKEVKILFFES